jgi:acetoin utilization deacetylase AcuC-like enzyme
MPSEPVCIFTHPSCLEHDPGPGHPERSARLAVILDALRKPAWQTLLRWHQAPAASLEQLYLAHERSHVERVLAAIPEQGLVSLDPDTTVCPASGSAALHAAGAVCAAVDAVLVGGDCRRAFCAVRPPGHHAERDQAMGFCLFGNVAIGALHAVHNRGLERVAVMDFDVHHGNGTENILQGKPGLLYVSTHQHPWYPGTGAGAIAGVDNVVNVPLPAGSGSTEFRDRFSKAVIPALDRFAPQLLLISAGFDAHHRDPLADIRLDADDFGWATEALLEVAERHAGGRVVSALEGGYDLEALTAATLAHLTALVGR